MYTGSDLNNKKEFKASQEEWFFLCKDVLFVGQLKNKK